MVEQLADDPATLLEAHKWILSILQVAAEVNLWSDTARPRFVEIVGPYKKWGGDNADAFYCYAPIDPTRTYRVTVQPGDAVYLSLTVYGGPDDGRYSERIVGAVNSRDAGWTPHGTFELVLSPEQPSEDGVAWIRLEPDAVAAITRDYLEDPKTGLRARWQIDADDPPATYREDDAGLARRHPGHGDVGARAGRHRAAAARGAERHRPALPRADRPPSAGRPATPPTPWAPSRWTTTRPWSSGAAHPIASSGTCACGTRCCTPTTTTTSPCTINGAQVEYEPDGSWTIVVSAARPRHPNWVSTAGHRSGRIWFRWFLPAHTPEHPDVEVVPVAAV